MEKQIKQPTAESVMAAINEADKNGNKELAKTLHTLYGIEKDDRPVTERIKTLEDACRELGEDHPHVQALNAYNSEMLPCVDGEEAMDIEAYLKLRIIVAALNEGWKPEFKEGEVRWYPWFTLYTQEEIDQMDDDEKERRRLCLWGGHASNGSYSGLGCVRSNYAFSNSSATCGCRLALRTEELATYAGQQFIEIYAAHQLGKQVKRYLKF